MGSPSLTHREPQHCLQKPAIRITTLPTPHPRSWSLSLKPTFTKAIRVDNKLEVFHAFPSHSPLTVPPTDRQISELFSSGRVLQEAPRPPCFLLPGLNAQFINILGSGGNVTGEEKAVDNFIFKSN